MTISIFISRKKMIPGNLTASYAAIYRSKRIFFPKTFGKELIKMRKNFQIN